jgi:two-component system chemotaxis response regulator CheY
VKTVLIVEDSATTRALIRAVVDDLDVVAVVEVSSGFEALKMLPQQEYDLIITDINMPDVNGLELIGFVKNNRRFTNLPVVIVSTERRRRRQEKGAFDRGERLSSQADSNPGTAQAGQQLSGEMR